MQADNRRRKLLHSASPKDGETTKVCIGLVGWLIGWQVGLYKVEYCKMMCMMEISLMLKVMEMRGQG